MIGGQRVFYANLVVKDNFALVPSLPPRIDILRSRAHPSHIQLPVMLTGVVKNHSLMGA
jgi:hypothetical protein